MSKNSFLLIYRTAFYLIVLTAVIGLISLVIHRYDSAEKSAERFQGAFLEMENAGNEFLDLLVSEKFRSDSSVEFSSELKNKKPDNSILFIYEADSLVYWSGNSIEINTQQAKEVSNSDFLKLKNGYYYFQVAENQVYKLILVNLIYGNFPFENEFIENGFPEKFPEQWRIEGVNKSALVYPVKSMKGEDVFYIAPTESRSLPGSVYYLLLILASALLVGSYHLSFLSCNIIFRTHSRLTRLSVTLSLIIAIRYLVLQLKWPEIIFGHELFGSALLSAGRLIPSLGDLWFHALTLLYCSFVFYKLNAFAGTKQLNHRKQIGLGVLLSTGLIMSGIIYLSLIKITIVNSSIPLSFKELYYFDMMSYLTFLIISLISVAFILALIALSRQFHSFLIARYTSVIVLLIFLVVSIVLVFSGEKLFHTEFILLLTAFILLLLPFSANQLQRNRLDRAFLLIFLSGLLATVFYYSNMDMADKKQNLIAFRLAEDSDPLFEFLYEEVSASFVTDTTLITHILRRDTVDQQLEKKVYDYLKDKYFYGYFNKFNINIVICQPEEQLLVRPGDFYIGCNDYFYGLIQNDSLNISGKTNELFLIHDYAQQTYYLARIELNRLLNDTAYAYPTLYLEFYNRFLPEGIGYPELLIDEQNDRSRDLSAYSFARYVDGVLAYKFGNYLYSNQLDDLVNYQYFYEDDNYRHLYYPVDEELVLVISRKGKGLIDMIAPFSYFVVFIGLLMIVVMALFGRDNGNTPILFNFRIKLQILLVASLILSFVIIAAVSFSYIRSFYQLRTNEVLKEKTQSILIELEHKLKGSDFNAPDIEPYLYQLLTKFSAVFFTDINLYDLRGRLMASSRPEIFEKGLISELMNREAFEELTRKGKLYFIHHEMVGSGKYLSSYIPFRNEEGVPVAFLNLPYFAKETELREEISSFLLTFLNILFMLTGMSVWLALVLSRRITSPLIMIQEKMQRLALGRPNEKLVYTQQDEIGQLVSQYNQLIDQLEESAVLLARSERESAWSEMARQVAHEIKNPLTPMRLSVQYLKKSWDERDPEIGDKINKTTQTIIEQIDALSEIASAFADFASMPVQKNEQVDLSEVIRHTIDLFAAHQNTEILFRTGQSEKLYVNADRKSLIRVFNNLIKNALQAIEGVEKGRVEVEMRSESETIVVRVTDNGKGMSQEQAARVFTPYFTTKTSGTGIGLSIVKNIIRTLNGDIQFETQAGKGTTFTLRLPNSIVND